MTAVYPPSVQAVFDCVADIARARGISADDEAGLDRLTRAAMALLTPEDLELIARVECEREVRAVFDADVAAGKLIYDADTDTYRLPEAAS